MQIEKILFNRTGILLDIELSYQHKSKSSLNHDKVLFLHVVVVL